MTAPARQPDAAPTRTVHQGDGVAWLRRARLDARHAVFTSLPDRTGTELDHDGWRRWFVDVAALICARVADDAVAVFYQTDVRHHGQWVDKAHLIHCGADRAGARCLWHKIVCRQPPGTTTYGRPGYGHCLAFSRRLRADIGASTADVLPELGAMSWSRATPLSAARATCAFLADQSACRIVVDPFCGRGTILAVANAHGLDAIGVELGRKRARLARRMTLPRQPLPEHPR